MNCPRCGITVQQGLRDCHSCGFALSGSRIRPSAAGVIVKQSDERGTPRIALAFAVLGLPAPLVGIPFALFYTARLIRARGMQSGVLPLVVLAAVLSVHVLLIRFVR